MANAERGQATIEWAALLLLVAVVTMALGYVATRASAWRIGEEIVEAVFCAALDDCPGALEQAYGDELARTLREYAPNVVYERGSAQLPVDFRRCRATDCADALDRGRQARSSGVGLPVTTFTRVIDRRSGGGAVYLQYWLYFPESFSGGIGRRLGPFSERWPGFHKDDWEGYQVRIEPDGARSARATAHGRYRGRKGAEGWAAWTGWYRISGGSHAGHLVAGPSGERTTRAGSLRLVPLERLANTDRYSFEVSPPWRKTVYRDPESNGS